MSARELAYKNRFRCMQGVRSAYSNFTARSLDVGLECRRSRSTNASSRRNGKDG